MKNLNIIDSIRSQLNSDKKMAFLKTVEEDIELTIPTSVRGEGIQVRCIETGEIFKSISAAGRATNSNPSNIGKCAKGGLKTAAKLHWEYI